MNIIDDAVGQTCNRFFEWLFYLNEAIVKGKRLVVLIPDKTIDDYPNLLHCKFLTFPLYFRKLTKIFGIKRNLHFIVKVRHLFFNSKLQRIYTFLSFGHLHIYQSLSKFPYHGDFSSIRQNLQDIFALRHDLRKVVDDAINNVDREKYILVGVHIRWGDYRTWLGGKYFFGLEVYNNYMLSMQKLLAVQKHKVKFLIACNEDIKLKDFIGVPPPIMINNGSATQDLYALSKCDYILGTTSTFSTWVSLVYNVPLYQFTTSEGYKTMSLDNFRSALCYDGIPKE